MGIISFFLFGAFLFHLSRYRMLKMPFLILKLTWKFAEKFPPLFPPLAPSHLARWEKISKIILNDEDVKDYLSNLQCYKDFKEFFKIPPI